MAKRIEAKDLNIYYGDFHAVESVNFTVEPRTVTAFIGPSGCGKSTVLRTLNRMHEVIAGAHCTGQVLLTVSTCMARESTRWRYVATSAWCSSEPTRSPPCPFVTMSWPG